ncbi:galactitol-1-phosphate 5-dehydrogenase [Eubacteriaceae bacterium ES2]|nr:galactitol-1-phosphate 5-dehydrogenase [Eubacteriaceae bacterium ES2]
MKAVRMYKPGDLRVEEVEIPEVQADEVLIKIRAVGLCGSDIPRALTYGAHVSPITIGHEFSGEVTETGKAVKQFKTGDRVVVAPLIPCYECEWCQKGIYSLCEHYDYYGSRRDGALAQYVAVKEANLLKVPDNVSYEDAATIDPCANAYHALSQANFQKGDSVCVVGTGPIGLFAAQYAKLSGASKVIAVDIWDEKLEIAKKVGADQTINSLNEDAVKAVRKATDGKGANIVIDFSGAPTAQKQCLLMASKMGKVVFLGISHKGLDLSEKEVDTLMRSQLSLIGSWNSFTAPFPGVDWTESIKMFAENGMTAKDIISHRLPLDEAPDVFAKIAAGGYFFNKIMFYPWGEN